jgi:hypothetical protein
MLQLDRRLHLAGSEKLSVWYSSASSIEGFIYQLPNACGAVYQSHSYTSA